VWSWAAGLPFQSVNPEFSNIGGKVLTVGSTIRWDPNKRRAFFSFAMPLKGNPAFGLRASIDARDENWISPSPSGRGWREAPMRVAWPAVFT
jgi:hypothetical protein